MMSRPPATIRWMGDQEDVDEPHRPALRDSRGDAGTRAADAARGGHGPAGRGQRAHHRARPGGAAAGGGADLGAAGTGWGLRPRPQDDAAATEPDPGRGHRDRGGPGRDQLDALRRRRAFGSAEADRGDVVAAAGGGDGADRPGAAVGDRGGDANAGGQGGRGSATAEPGAGDRVPGRRGHRDNPDGGADSPAQGPRELVPDRLVPAATGWALLPAGPDRPRPADRRIGDPAPGGGGAWGVPAGLPETGVGAAGQRGIGRRFRPRV